jgi:pimeloyl-ACP methyl ester carboxylesterase
MRRQITAQDGFITVNDVRLHYLDWGGKGETLLFLHGMGDTAHIYDKFATGSPTDFACSHSPGAVTANLKSQRAATTRDVSDGHSANS